MEDSSSFQALSAMLARLPGLGQRSAKRVVLHLLQNRQNIMVPLAGALQQAASEVKTCQHCYNLDSCDPCRICMDSTRQQQQLCVVEQVADLWSVERTGHYKGHYHVLGGVLSALYGAKPQDLQIVSLQERVKQSLHRSTAPYQEIILALSATVEGQATAHYLTEQLHNMQAEKNIPPITMTRLAFGLPMGGELHYLDDATLNAAFKARVKTS
ncbi:MAG: recombination mediator RecR [Alphaproteobacteria bacterium]